MPKFNPIALSSVPIFCLAFNILGSSSGELLSPIKNLEASIAAATSHGSIVAVHSDYDDAIILISRSPTVRSNLTLASIRNHGEDCIDCDEIFGSEVSTGPVSVTSGMVYAMNPQLVVGMTGLASDVRHLSRYLGKLNANYGHLHGRSFSMSSIKATQTLSSKMAHTASVSGARPFGVEAIIIGSGGMIATIDPSGGLRTWGDGTCIGKYSHQVRNHLTSLLKSNKDDDNETLQCKQEEDYIEKSLRFGIEAIVKAYHDSEGCLGPNICPEQFECIVVWSCSGKKSRIINKACIRTVFERCCEIVNQ